MKKDTDKLFVIRKYVKAKNAAEALKKEKTTPVDDVWIDDQWRKENTDRLADAIGFSYE